MRNENDYLLSDLLISWHRWSAGYGYAGQPSTSAMFSSVPSPKQWEDTREIADRDQRRATMEAIDFAVNGGERREGALPEPHRTAIEFHARNLNSGVQVWSSPRLPSDPEELGVLTLEARNMLAKRLFAAGLF